MPAMNALAAVMDDLNWLWEHGHPHLAGLTPTAALEALRVADGGVLCTDGAASASEVSTVLRKAQEAQASGAHTCVVWGGGVSGGGTGVRGAHTHTPRYNCPTTLQARVVCWGIHSGSIHQWQHTPKVKEGVIVGCSVRQTREATTANKLPRMCTS